MRTTFVIIAAILDWIAGLRLRPRSSSPAEAPIQPASPAAQIATQSRFGGRAWSVDADGVHADGHLWRTPGAPVTCRAILARYGNLIAAAAGHHGLDPALLVMTIATEAGNLRTTALPDRAASVGRGTC